jgi:adenine/guanine phosphoribosyltransferase-like PRPP-binding protein
MNYKPVTSKWSAPCADYLFKAFFNSEAALTGAARTILKGFQSFKHNPKTKRDEESFETFDFDTIVCTGISGVVFAPALAKKMGRKIAIVRKARDGTHSSNKVEADCFDDEFGNYIIVDDLISSGNTVKRITKAITKHTRGKGRCVGVYLYSYDELRKP